MCGVSAVARASERPRGFFSAGVTAGKVGLFLLQLTDATPSLESGPQETQARMCVQFARKVCETPGHKAVVHLCRAINAAEPGDVTIGGIKYADAIKTLMRRAEEAVSSKQALGYITKVLKTNEEARDDVPDEALASAF